MPIRYDDAPEVEPLLRRIRFEHFPELVNAKIRVLYDLRKRGSNGSVCLGRIIKANDLIRHLTTDEASRIEGYDYIITLDKVCWDNIGEVDRERIIRHELRHTFFDIESKSDPYKLVAHDIQVIKEHGYPVISKDKAGKIQLLQNPTEKNSTVRNAIITGDTGAFGGWRKGTRMRLPQKWLDLFAGPENEKYGTNYKTAPFKVSPDCCYYMKEKPANDWAKANKVHPYMGLMASEGGQRQKALMKHGCNYYGKTVTRSCPFAIFSRTDLLQLVLDLEAPVPEIYGEIKQQRNGTLETTKAKRTGCTMCGFGIHIEKRPHRFDRLRETSPKEWEFWMYKMGWGRVLDYIGVAWEDDLNYTPLFGLSCHG